MARKINNTILASEYIQVDIESETRHVPKQIETEKEAHVRKKKPSDSMNELLICLISFLKYSQKKYGTLDQLAILVSIIPDHVINSLNGDVYKDIEFKLNPLITWWKYNLPFGLNLSLYNKDVKLDTLNAHILLSYLLNFYRIYNYLIVWTDGKKVKLLVAFLRDEGMDFICLEDCDFKKIATNQYSKRKGFCISFLGGLFIDCFY